MVLLVSSHKACQYSTEREVAISSNVV